jgi:hypothetical protein
MLLAEIVVRPNYDVFIDGVVPSIMVLSVQELISLICCTQFIFQEHIVLLSFREVSSDSWTYLPGIPIVAEVCMVGVYKDRDFSAF